jgi:hypothetical protein
LQRCLLQRGMNMVDYCAIQFSKQQIVAADTDRQLRDSTGDEPLRHFVRSDAGPTLARVPLELWRPD